MPDRFQSSEESSPAQGDGKTKKTDKKDKKKEKKPTKKKGKHSKKKLDDEEDDDDANCDDEHNPLGVGKDDEDDEDDFHDLEGYSELIDQQEGTKGGSKKRPASSKAAPRKRPSKKHDEARDALMHSYWHHRTTPFTNDWN